VADHLISLLSGSDEEGKNRIKTILDVWEADGALPPDAPDSSSSKPEVAAPAPPSTGDSVVPGFALSFFEELWWLTRRYVTPPFYSHGWSDYLLNWYYQRVDAGYQGS